MRKRQRAAMAAKSGSSSSSVRPQPPLDPSKLRTGDDPDDDYYYPEGVKDPQVWAKYLNQIKESEGFDIVDYPGHCLGAWIVPINFQRSPFETQRLTNLASVAIQEYNKKNRRTKYQVVKVLTVNSSVCEGVVYYITFQAKERKRRNPAVKTFQAKVWDGIGHVTVRLCRLKKIPDQQVSLS